MTKLTGAALERAVANAMGLKSVNNCEKWGTSMIEDDDDIQDYKKAWVGLTDEERSQLVTLHHGWNEYGQAIEAKLKEKNNGV